MKMAIVGAFGIAALFGVSPTYAGSPSKFSIMNTWDAGHSTATDKPTDRIEVGDQMYDRDAPLCASLLAILNRSAVPARHFDDLDQPVLPSGLTAHVWVPMGIPRISTAAMNKEDGLKTILGEMSDCNRPPRHKGDIPISCSFAQTEIHFLGNEHLHLIRMIAHPKIPTSYRWAANYFLADSDGKIADQFFPQVGDQFGGGTVFTFEGIDYIAGWNREVSDFSDGYEGRKFKRPKITFEVASFHDTHGPTALRSCVFTLSPMR